MIDPIFILWTSVKGVVSGYSAVREDGIKVVRNSYKFDTFVVELVAIQYSSKKWFTRW